jgi:hypothetical protein
VEEEAHLASCLIANPRQHTEPRSATLCRSFIIRPWPAPNPSSHWTIIMILARNKWPEAVRDFLEGRREVSESAMARRQPRLRSPMKPCGGLCITR